MTSPTALDQESNQAPRRAATRARILAGAKTVFFSSGFAAAMMEQIAEAAGTRRSTIYLHFREKEDILAAIAIEYTKKIAAVVALLPSPAPTPVQVREWVSILAEFVCRESAPTELLVALSHLPEVPASARRFGDDFVTIMGMRLPSFAAAMASEGLAGAWAVAALENLCWALCNAARTGRSSAAEHRLTVAAEMLSRAIDRQR